MDRIMVGISVDPHVAFGKPVIEGTRVRVEDVLEALARGLSAQDVCEEYDLSAEQVKNALLYASNAMRDQRQLIQ
jgi:uncharacterized protein (DUF433 family)